MLQRKSGLREHASAYLSRTAVRDSLQYNNCPASILVSKRPRLTSRSRRSSLCIYVYFIFSLAYFVLLDTVVCWCFLDLMISFKEQENHGGAAAAEAGGDERRWR
jgi:hypothetical protein